MTPTIEALRELGVSIQRIVDLNEAAMYRKEQTALTLGKTVLFGGMLVFALVLMYSPQIAYRPVSKCLFRSGPIY